jgi:hypothetical protein
MRLRVRSAARALVIPGALIVSSITVCAAADITSVQQNELVRKYCAVCHTDAARNGGLSLEHYDAARPDPGLAAMLLGKLRTGAMGAAGIGLPGAETRLAWTRAIAAAAAGSDRWHIEQERADAPISASIVREIASPTPDGVPDSYRLAVSCQPATHRGSVELTWSPNVPKAGQIMSAEVDGNRFATYKIEDEETMGNGMGGKSGPGAISLFPAGRSAPLPLETLKIRDVFPGQAVVFPFRDLPASARRALSACFQ